MASHKIGYLKSQATSDNGQKRILFIHITRDNGTCKFKYLFSMWNKMAAPDTRLLQPFNASGFPFTAA
jgi:hypothetical protein